MADRIKSFQQETNQINILKSIRTDLGATASSYTPDTSVVTKDRVVTYAQAEEELSVLGDIEEGVKQQVADLDIAQKDIKNIKSLLQGNLYDYQTDSDSKYTKTVPNGAMPYASLDSIGGKTVVWNQLNDFSINYSNVGGITHTLNGDGSVTLNGTSTSSGSIYFMPSSTTWQGVYYVHGCPSGGENGYGLAIGAGKNDKGSGAIQTYNSSTGAGFRFNLDSGVTFNNVTFYPQVHNLTLMFGSGNEPTLEQCQQMFPASYYSYNAGTLLSAGVTEVVSQGRNIVDQDTILGAVYNAVKTDGYWQVATNQLYLKYRFNNYSSNASPIFTQTALTMSFDIKLDSSESSGSTLYYGFFKSNQSSATLNSVNFTNTWQRVSVSINDNVECKIAFSYASALKVNIRNFQIQVGTTATDYSPHHAPISYPIPAEIQALEGYGWSAGSVSNYVDYERKVFVQNVASVDLSTLTWSYTASNYWATATGVLSLAKAPANGGVKVNAVCSTLPIDSSNNVSTNLVVGIGVRPNLGLYAVNGSSVDSPTGMLYYELATPQEIDISAYLTDDNLIEVESGGTLTFPNANGDDYRIDVPSQETYMVDLQEAI